MQFVSSDTINRILDFPMLIDVLEEGFREEIQVPQRMHLDYTTVENESSNTLLLMPAVKVGEFAGVKIVNVAPGNDQAGLATIQGVYYLMDAVTGEPKAIFDARSITNWRTAAASALASRFLSKADASTLLMIGTGALAPYLIRAHAAVRPIKHLIVFGRSAEKAEAVALPFKDQFETVRIVNELDAYLLEADIISAATSSESPLIKGALLRPGQHIDLVGAFRPTTRESDDEVMKRGSIYADYLDSVLHEAGDIMIPLQSGVISADDLHGDLFQLCQDKVKGRKNPDEITVFKSVGHAMEDLVTAILLYKRLSAS